MGNVDMMELPVGWLPLNGLDSYDEKIKDRKAF